MSVHTKTLLSNSNRRREDGSASVNHTLTRPESRWPGANLFRNPFGELTRRERAELAVVDTAPIVDAIRVAPFESRPVESRPVQLRPFAAYQMIGECGRGKTTRMLAIRKQFPLASYVYLPEDEPCPAIPDGQPLMIDEAQRLPRRIRRTVFGSGATLILATHKDLSAALRRSGYTVSTERIGLSLSAEQLVEMLNRRIEASRRDRDRDRSEPRVSVDDGEELIRRFGTDIRAIESYLYDIVQSQVNHHGEMRFID